MACSRSSANADRTWSEGAVLTDNKMTPNAPIRVVFNAIHARSGGGITYVMNLLPALAASAAFDVHIIIHVSQYARFAELDERVRIHVVDFKESTLFSLLWEQIPLVYMIRDMKPDVVVSPANYGPLFMKNHIIVLQNSLAVGAHETRFKKKIYWSLLGLMTKMSLLTSKAAVAVSHYVLKTVLSQPMRGEGKVRVIHHGVEDIFCPATERRGDFLLAVGDLYVQKNFETLIRAVAIVKKEFSDIKLVVAGSYLDAEYCDFIFSLVKELSLQDNVQFLGHCQKEKLIELYANCRVFVFPSVEESFGMPVVEAMASGCAVACSNFAAMPEVAGDAVVYFDPTDAQDMSKAIVRLWAHADLRAEHSAKALERAKLFSWQRAAADFGDLAQKVAGRNWRADGPA